MIFFGIIKREFSFFFHFINISKTITITSDGVTISSYSCQPNCVDGTVSNQQGTVTINCCQTDRCNVYKGNEIVNKAFDIAIIVGSCVGGFCLLVCVTIVVSVVIYCCCCRTNPKRGLKTHSPPSIYIVDSNKMDNIQPQQQHQYPYQSQSQYISQPQQQKSPNQLHDDVARESSSKFKLPPLNDQVKNVNPNRKARTSHGKEEEHIEMKSHQFIDENKSTNISKAKNESEKEDHYFDRYFGGYNHNSNSYNNDNDDGVKKELNRIPYL